MFEIIDQSVFDFIAIDFETANMDYWSICQAGFAYFKDSNLVFSKSFLVDPQTYFDDFNVAIHGISKEDVAGAPKLKDLFDFLHKQLSENIVVSHTAFDRIAIRSLEKKLKKNSINCIYLDSSVVARRTFIEVRKSGYGLYDLSIFLNIPIVAHHNAGEDAISSGKIILKSIRESNKTFEDWVENAKHKYELWGTSKTEFRDLARSDPNVDGPLYGEFIVFTGALSISRLEAAQKAYLLGCDIDTGVTKKTTILVVGDQVSRKLAGYEKSSKHRKAEDLIRSGQNIRIIGEDDFFSMIDSN